MADYARWSDEAELTLLGLPLSEAERLLDSVEHLAITGKGFVRAYAEASGILAHHVKGYEVVFTVDADGVFHVRKINRYPTPR